MASRSQVLTDNTNSFPNNNSGAITPAVLRDFNQTFINSVRFTDEVVPSATSASYAENANKLDGLDSTSFVSTGSFNSYSSSMSTRMSNQEAFSSSLDATFATEAEVNAATASLSASIASTYVRNNQTSSMSVLSSSFAVTASYALFAANGGGAIDTGSFVTTSSFNAYSSSAATTYVRNNQTSSMTVLSASFAASALSASFVQNAVSASFAQSAGTAGSAQTASYVLNAVSASFASTAVSASQASNAVSASFASTATSASSAVSANTAISSSFAQNANNASTATSASFASNATSASFSSTSISASFATNTSTAQTATSSSFATTAATATSASFATNAASATSASFAQNSTTASHAVSALSSSFAVTASFASTLATGLNITASNILVNNNLVVNGTASFAYTQVTTGSAVIIGEEFIILNANPPAARYAGIQVYDSASSATASLEWDGSNDNWIIVEETGLSAGIITGLTGSKGSEVYPSNNRLIKGSGHHTVSDSSITDNGVVVSINEDTQITGSLIVTAGVTGSLLGTASFALNAGLLNNTSSGVFATTGSNNFIGDQFITGSTFIKPTTTTGEQPLNIIEITDGTGFEGNLIVGRSTNAAATGSIVISGSGNIYLPSLGASNSTTNNGGATGFSANSSIINGLHTVTGSNGSGYSRVYSRFTTSVVNAGVSVTDNRPTGTTTNPVSISNSSINGTISATLTSSSFSLSGVNTIGTLTISSTGSVSTAKSISNSLLGVATITSDNNSGNVIQNSVIIGPTLLLSGSSNGVLQNSIVVGNGLVVTGSATTTAQVGSTYVGRFNDTGATALAADTAFAVGTGTSTSVRRTSLHVSSSGLTTISNGLITGSLIGTASFASTASFVNTLSQELIISGSVRGEVKSLSIA